MRLVLRKKTIHQRRLAVIGIANNEQVGHAVRSGPLHEVLESPVDVLRARVAKSTGRRGSSRSAHRASRESRSTIAVRE